MPSPQIGSLQSGRQASGPTRLPAPSSQRSPTSIAPLPQVETPQLAEQRGSAPLRSPRSQVSGGWTLPSPHPGAAPNGGSGGGAGGGDAAGQGGSARPHHDRRSGEERHVRRRARHVEGVEGPLARIDEDELEQPHGHAAGAQVRPAGQGERILVVPGIVDDLDAQLEAGVLDPGDGAREDHAHGVGVDLLHRARCRAAVAAQQVPVVARLPERCVQHAVAAGGTHAAGPAAAVGPAVLRTLVARFATLADGVAAGGQAAGGRAGPGGAVLFAEVAKLGAIDDAISTPGRDATLAATVRDPSLVGVSRVAGLAFLADSVAAGRRLGQVPSGCHTCRAAPAGGHRRQQDREEKGRTTHVAIVDRECRAHEPREA